MKKSKVCPKCQSLRIGYVEKLKDYSGESLNIGMFDALADSAIRSKWIRYEVEGYLCADCGYLETYVKSPESVDYRMISGFRWINPDPSEEGPYR